MSQVIVNRGKAGSALNGQNGSTSGVDSNDALFLDWSGENYVYLPGVNGNFLSVPDSAPLDITGDIDIRVQVALDDWTPATAQVLVSKFDNNTVAERAYELQITTTGLISISFAQAGGSDGLIRSSTVAPTISDGQPLWVRATLDVDNGASGHDAKFFTSPDGVSWTQLGATVTTAGTFTIRDSGAEQVVIGRRSTGAFGICSGKFYRAQIFNGIDGTKVLDVDTSVITTGAATSFTALTGQTITIGRSTSGRKTVAVVSPVWLFGTDDYMEVADSALLDFGAADDFTVVAVMRQPSYTAAQAVLAKRDSSSSGAGFQLRNAATATTSNFGMSDGTTAVSSDVAGRTAGALEVLAVVRNVIADNITQYRNSVANTPVTDTTTAALANALPFRVGRFSGSGTNYADMELLAVLIYRRALTATEISRITAYYQARLS